MQLSNKLETMTKAWSSGLQTRLTIERLWVQILSHPTLDGNGVKAMPGWLKYPILVHSIQHLKRKKIQVANWGTPKNFFNNNKLTWNNHTSSDRKKWCITKNCVDRLSDLGMPIYLWCEQYDKYISMDAYNPYI